MVLTWVTSPGHVKEKRNGSKTSKINAARGLQSARTNLAQYKILEEMKLSETEAASRLYKRIALPSKGFPLPRPVPTPVFCSAVKCVRSFKLDSSDDGAMISVRPSFDNFLTVRGFSDLTTSTGPYEGHRTSNWSFASDIEISGHLPDLEAGDLRIEAHAVQLGQPGLEAVEGVDSRFCAWTGPFKTSVASTGTLTVDGPSAVPITVRVYGNIAGVWSVVASGVTTGQANVLTLNLNNVDVPSMAASYDSFLMSMEAAMDVHTAAISIAASKFSAVSPIDSKAYRPTDLGQTEFDSIVGSSEFLSITAFSCLVSFMGHSLYDGGQICAALVPYGTDLPGGIDARFGFLTSLTDHSYNGRLSKGAYGHYIPGRVQDLFFTKERTVNGNSLQYVIKNAPAGTAVDLTVRIETVFCYETITNSPNLPKVIGSREHQLVDLLVAFAHMETAVSENPNHVKIIAEKAKAFAKRPEVREAMKSALKMAAKGAISLAPLLFP